MVDVAYERIAPRTQIDIVLEENELHVILLPDKKLLIRVAIGDDENLEALADRLSEGGFPAAADRVRVMAIEARRG